MREPTSYITVQTSDFLYLLFDVCMSFGRCKVFLHKIFFHKFVSPTFHRPSGHGNVRKPEVRFSRDHISKIKPASTARRVSDFLYLLLTLSGSPASNSDMSISSRPDSVADLSESKKMKDTNPNFYFNHSIFNIRYSPFNIHNSKLH